MAVLNKLKSSDNKMVRYKLSQDLKSEREVIQNDDAIYLNSQR